MAEVLSRDWVVITYKVMAPIVGIGTLPLLFFAFAGVLVIPAFLLAASPVDSDFWKVLLIAGWAVAGVLGYFAWVRMTMQVFWHGKAGLRQLRAFWWWFLAMGMIASIGVVALSISEPWHSPDWATVTLMPIPMLFLAGYLVFLRLRKDADGSVVSSKSMGMS